MKDFLTGVGVIFSLEMRQRLRGVAWYVLLGVFFFIFLIVTLLTAIIVYTSGDPDSHDNLGAPLYSILIYFVLLLGVLVAPAMSGNAINGDRDAGTLATTQVTLITTGQLIIGKFLAAWLTALGFLVIALPFLIYGAIVGGPSPATVAVSLLVLAAELGVVAAIGVGLSGLIVRPLFSVVVTYLTVAALTLGTLIAFTLGGLAVQTKVVSYYYNDVSRTTSTCTHMDTYVDSQPRFDLDWGILAPNPFVLISDAVPSTYDHSGNAKDLFGDFKLTERNAQIGPDLHETPASACKQQLTEGNYIDASGDDYSSKHIVDSTIPSWPIGLAIQLVLAAGALLGAWSRTRTPARRLARGSRVA